MEYKGIYCNNNDSDEPKYYEFGAHFKYKDLYKKLKHLELKQKEKEDSNNNDIIPNKKIEFQSENIGKSLQKSKIKKKSNLIPGGKPIPESRNVKPLIQSLSQKLTELIQNNKKNVKKFVTRNKICYSNQSTRNQNYNNNNNITAVNKSKNINASVNNNHNFDFLDLNYLINKSNSKSSYMSRNLKSVVANNFSQNKSKNLKESTIKKSNKSINNNNLNNFVENIISSTAKKKKTNMDNSHSNNNNSNNNNVADNNNNNIINQTTQNIIVKPNINISIVNNINATFRTRNNGQIINEIFSRNIKSSKTSKSNNNNNINIKNTKNKFSANMKNYKNNNYYYNNYMKNNNNNFSTKKSKIMNNTNNSNNNLSSNSNNKNKLINKKLGNIYDQKKSNNLIFRNILYEEPNKINTKVFSVKYNFNSSSIKNGGNGLIRHNNILNSSQMNGYKNNAGDSNNPNNKKIADLLIKNGIKVQGNKVIILNNNFMKKGSSSIKKDKSKKGNIGLTNNNLMNKKY